MFTTSMTMPIELDVSSYAMMLYASIGRSPRTFLMQWMSSNSTPKIWNLFSLAGMERLTLGIAR